MLKRTLVILVLTLSIFSTASAEEFTIEADGYHTVSRKETILEAEEAAVNDVLRWAVEQIGVRISAYSEVVNKVLKEDTVQRFASSVVKIKEKTLTPKVMNDDYRIYAHVVCVVNTDDLDRWEPPDIERQRRLEEDKKRLKSENERLNSQLSKRLPDNEYYTFRKKCYNAKNNDELRQIIDEMIDKDKAYDRDERLQGLISSMSYKIGEYFGASCYGEKAINNGESDSLLYLHIADSYILTGSHIVENLMLIGHDSNRYSKLSYETATNMYERGIYSSGVGMPQSHNLLKLAVCYWNLGNYNRFYDLVSTAGGNYKWHDELDKWLTKDKKPKINGKINGYWYITHDLKENNGIPTRFYEKSADNNKYL